MADVIEGAPLSGVLHACAGGLPRREVDLMFRLDVDFRMSTSATRGLAPELEAFMERELLDPRTNPVVEGFPRMGLGRIEPLAAFSDLTAYQRSDAYQRFARPLRADYGGAFRVRRPTGHYVAVTGRRERDGWFSAEEAARLAALYDDLARACDLRTRLVEIEGAGDRAGLLLDIRMRPVRVFAPTGGPPCLRVSAAGVSPLDASRRPAFARAFVEALRHGPEAERRLLLRDPDGALHVVTLVCGPTVPFGRTVVVRSSPLARPVWTAASLRDVFGMTPREAATVLQVLRGASTEEACSALAVSPETVKTHLAAAFAKTGTDSRVRLISRLLGHDG
jgi:DNA-binding CsgD family transcriptional regulator